MGVRVLNLTCNRCGCNAGVANITHLLNEHSGNKKLLAQLPILCSVCIERLIPREIENISDPETLREANRLLEIARKPPIPEEKIEAPGKRLRELVERSQETFGVPFPGDLDKLEQEMDDSSSTYMAGATAYFGED
jgi:hypothetical protein